MSTYSPYIDNEWLQWWITICVQKLTGGCKKAEHIHSGMPKRDQPKSGKPFVCVCVYIYIYTCIHTHTQAYTHMKLMALESFVRKALSEASPCQVKQDYCYASIYHACLYQWHWYSLRPSANRFYPYNRQAFINNSCVLYRKKKANCCISTNYYSK